jgi:20S proteasome subunit alpha 6
MQKNLYDYSTLIWSPQGRIYQLEYAMEAVNQGNLLLGLRSKSHVVLCGLKSSSHDTLSYHQEKLFKVSSHMGMGVAGLTPDGSKIIINKILQDYFINI